MKKSICFIIILILLLTILFVFFKKRNISKEKENQNYQDVSLLKNFDTNIIKLIHENNNYLISPYSIKIALNMLRDGSSGITKEELDKVIGNSKINILSMKDKLSVSNALFLRNIYQNNILPSYVNNLKKQYDAEILIDKYETPKVINDWVNKKTNGMIPKILDTMSSDFVLGLINAIALDVKWQNTFECNNTKSEEFTLIDNTKMNVEMMHKKINYQAKYLKNNDYEGIILPYEEEDNINLEFIAFIPKDIDIFINNIQDDTLDNLYNNFHDILDTQEINLSLPRFTYEYEINDFIGKLKKLGLKSAFTPSADFSNMINIHDVYFDTAIHKTKIELNENGTKAAAVTFFGMKNAAFLPQEKEIINITFNKPFIYMIRDNKTKELLFFGSVYNPNKWKAGTCSN